MVVVENTDDVHHVIVCTLCSCYPWPVLGLPPNWYKQPAYRARIVREPRKVLREEFGLDVPDSVEVRVWDSSVRAPLLGAARSAPRAPRASSEEQLAALVTRDSMIGVGAPSRPDAATAQDAPSSGDARRRVEALVAETAGRRRARSFEQPWELRAFALAVAAYHAGQYEWSEFQLSLIASISGGRPTAPTGDEPWSYYEHWLTALETVLAGNGLLSDATSTTHPVGPRDPPQRRPPRGAPRAGRDRPRHPSLTGARPRA